MSTFLEKFDKKSLESALTRLSVINPDTKQGAKEFVINNLKSTNIYQMCGVLGEDCDKIIKAKREVIHMEAVVLGTYLKVLLQHMQNSKVFITQNGEDTQALKDFANVTDNVREFALLQKVDGVNPRKALETCYNCLRDIERNKLKAKFISWLDSNKIPYNTIDLLVSMNAINLSAFTSVVVDTDKIKDLAHEYDVNFGQNKALNKLLQEQQEEEQQEEEQQEEEEAK